MAIFNNRGSGPHIQMYGKLKIFSGTANPELARRICDCLGEPLGDAEVSKFSNGEIFVKICQSVRGNDVFVIQSLCGQVNDSLMELLLIIDALRRASAQRITAVLPHYAYARQDKKDEPRVPISAKLVANLITMAGADRILTMDLHAMQIQGFFDIPVDHLYASPVLVEHFSRKNIENFVVVAPDTGRAKLARAIGKILNAPIAIMDKRRPKPNVAEVLNVVGDVRGRDAVIWDDLIDTAGTLIEAVGALREAGARDIYACCTHPVLSGPALERIESSELKEVVVTDTIPLNSRGGRCDKIKVLSVAGLFAEAIKRIHWGESISVLFDND
ncbi:MAG: ribose-phosphate diphosphokinase [bacterium]